MRQGTAGLRVPPVLARVPHGTSVTRSLCPTWREQRVPPRHAPVWVRIAGTWRRGLIAEWVTTPGSGTGDYNVMADEPPGSPPWAGRYVYDPAAIRPGHGEVPPG